MLDSPAAVSGDVIGRAVKPADDTGQVREWLDICQSQHSCLSASRAANGMLLTRILDVSKHSLNETIILVESNGRKGNCVALSHGWGSASITQTTKSNLAAHMQDILY